MSSPGAFRAHQMQPAAPSAIRNCVRSDMIDDEDRATVEPALLAIERRRPRGGRAVRSEMPTPMRSAPSAISGRRLAFCCADPPAAMASGARHGGAEEWRGDDVLAEFLSRSAPASGAEPEASRIPRAQGLPGCRDRTGSSRSSSGNLGRLLRLRAHARERLRLERLVELVLKAVSARRSG